MPRPYTFNVPENATSGMEFVDLKGELSQKERDFLLNTKETVLAHIESIDDRLVRYQEYHDLNNEDFQLICESVVENVKLENHTIALDELKKTQGSDAKPIVTIQMGHSKLVVKLLKAGEEKESIESQIATICEGHEMVASTVFEWIATTVGSLIKDQKEVEVLFATSHALTENDYSIQQLSGGFYEKAASDGKTFKITSDDPIIGVPIPELLNHAFKVHQVSAKCLGVSSVAAIEHCATVELGHDPFAIISLNLSDGFHCSGTDFDIAGKASIRKLDFSDVTIPANNIDQNYNFAQCRSRGTNYLGRMASTESIAVLTRMAWYHICQEKAPAVCWAESLTTANVLTAVYEPEKAGAVLEDWLKCDVTDADVKRFQAVTKMITERCQTIIAAVIVGYADVSGRVYDSFGTSKAIVCAEVIADYPKFLAGIQEKTQEALTHGKIDVVLEDKAFNVGASVFNVGALNITI